MGIIIAVLLFSFIIIFHELGHFLLAKKNGIRVDEFSLGLGPTLLGKQIGETKFSLKLLPFGGACMMGEDDADDLSEGKSFYMKEVDTIKEMISRSQEGTANLFLFDEIFKGTNTTERIAVAKAVLSYLNTTDNIIVASTHDAELATLLDTEYDLYHFSEVIQDETFSFDYKLKSGPLYQRNAIRLLEINGFPPTVIRDAYRTIEKISYPPTSTQPL